MDYYTSYWKKVKAMSPFELMEIMTGGACPEVVTEAKRQFEHKYGNYNGWPNKDSTKIDLLDTFLSDTGFTTLAKKERAKELEGIFRGYGVFFEVWCNWYGGDHYKVGFNYSREAFDAMYTIYLRDKKLSEII